MLLQLGGYYSQGILSRDQLVDALFGAGQQGFFYDPADLSTLFQERTGASATTPAGADDPVGTILDVSGNGNHATALNDAVRKILRTDGTYWWFEADGIDDFFFIDRLFANSTAAQMTLLAANQHDSVTIGAIVSTRPVTAGEGWTLRNNNATDLYYFHTSQSPNILRVAGTGMYVAEVERDGFDVRLGTNGVFSIVEQLSGYTIAQNKSTLGAEKQGTSGFLSGKIGSVVLVENVLSEVIRKHAEAWIADKNGIIFS